MSATLSVDARIPTRAADPAAGAADRLPWYVWCSLAAVTSILIGGYWDISWHMSIGRDTFWTPPHLAIQLGGVLAGVSCGYLILSTTFSPNAALRDASVSVWGVRGPLGAFLAAWGGVTMVVSAPFDNWWHSAYGLDVRIFSPPHTVLDTGILGVQVGGLLLILAAMNRAAGQLRARLERSFLLLGSTLVILGLTVVWEYTYRVHMHSARCYRAVSIVAPVVMVGVARASGRRWAATTLAAIYSAYLILFLWIFPLFPAQPKLGPVYQPVTHFIPMEFPLLIIVPALVLDVLAPRIAGWSKWSQAVVAGSAFLASFVAAQWPFASFLMSPASHNWVFGTHYFAYFEAPFWYDVRGLFRPDATRFDFRVGMAEALGFAIVGTRLGLAWGDWMRRIRR